MTAAEAHAHLAKARREEQLWDLAFAIVGGGWCFVIGFGLGLYVLQAMGG